MQDLLWPKHTPSSLRQAVQLLFNGLAVELVISCLWNNSPSTTETICVNVTIADANVTDSNITDLEADNFTGIGRRLARKVGGGVNDDEAAEIGEVCVGGNATLVRTP